MKAKKNNLDERQEQILLKIEHRACWLAYALLLASILIQEVLYPGDLRAIAGEWIVFMLLCVYILHGCLRNGIWDRRLQPNFRTNLLASFVAAVVVGLIAFAIGFRRMENPDPKIVVLICAIAAGVTFAACLILLSIAAAATKRKQRQLEEAPEEDADEPQA